MRAVAIAGSGRAARSFLERLRSAGIEAIKIDLPQGPELSGETHSVSDAHVPDRAHTLVIVPRDIAETEALLFERQGLAHRLPGLKAIIVAATLSPRYVRALRGRIPDSIALVDAPFSGTPRAADEGRLTFFLGGPKDEIERLTPLFDLLGRHTLRMGGFGTAMAAKVMNDFLAASSHAMTRLALDWAEAQGIDESRILDMSGNLLAGLTMPGYDVMDATSEDASISALVCDVEAALDSALTGAHLTPPRSIEQIFRGMKTRPLH